MGLPSRATDCLPACCLLLLVVDDDDDDGSRNDEDDGCGDDNNSRGDNDDGYSCLLLPPPRPLLTSYCPGQWSVEKPFRRVIVAPCWCRSSNRPTDRRIDRSPVAAAVAAAIAVAKTSSTPTTATTATTKTTTTVKPSSIDGSCRLNRKPRSRLISATTTATTTRRSCCCSAPVVPPTRAAARLQHAEGRQRREQTGHRGIHGPQQTKRRDSVSYTDRGLERSPRRAHGGTKFQSWQEDRLRKLRRAPTR